MKKKLLTIMMLFTASIGLVACETSTSKDDKVIRATNSPEKTDSNEEEGNKDQENDNQENKFRVGETAEFKNIQATLLNVTESNGSEFNTPEEGKVFVLAEIEITNNSDKDLAISSMMSFEAYQDGYSTSTSFSAMMENTAEQLDGTISPGKKMKGVIGYELPIDYKELEIHLSLDLLSDTKIVFVYEKQ